MKAFAKQFYKSTAWRKCRAAFIAKRKAIDGGLCQMCGEQLGYIVHHITELNELNINDPNITLNFQNLQFVCKNCHDKEHGFFTLSEKRLKFDSDGNPIPPP